MKFRVPSYYKKFKCIAGDCRHSCCIGWEVDIDEDTSSYYKSVGGAFGERLKKHMVSEEIDYFALKENGWCPFLNEQKLCDICIELGEEALSEVCTEYPRFTMEYENVREKVLSLSCEEVGRLVFSSDAKMMWEEHEMPGNIESWEDGMEPQQVSAETLEAVRTHAVELLQDRRFPVFERAAAYLCYCRQMQQTLFGGGEQEAVLEIATEKYVREKTKQQTDEMSRAEVYAYFKKRMECYEELEVLDETWTQVKEELLHTFTEENYLELLREYLASDSVREYEYEHLLVYFTFRYFMRAYYDDNILSKAQFAVLSVLLIRDMDVARYLANGRDFTLADRIDTARIYSREVEHSEENMEILEDDFRFEELLSAENLVAQLGI